MTVVSVLNSVTIAVHAVKQLIELLTWSVCSSTCNTIDEMAETKLQKYYHLGIMSAFLKSFLTDKGGDANIVSETNHRSTVTKSLKKIIKLNLLVKNQEPQ